ncbi:MAG: sulfite exporter TauE/SafE family protein [Candidatus Protistobacter heckmanni]|nr:sulfite exporter TauE/SafE family protein [Candidatus Protistobacter heckmanni]
MSIILLSLGAFGGFAAGLLGVGGGMILVPFLTFIFSQQGMSDELVTHVAIATSMATIVFTSLSNVYAHQKKGAVRWDIVAAIVPGVLVGTVIGGKVFKWMPTGPLALFFALFVGFSAWQMIANRKLKPSRNMPGKIGTAGAGGVIGFLSSLVGAGGGFLSVPFMSWCNVPMHNAVATSAALGFPIAVFASLNNIWNTYDMPGLPPHSLGYINVLALVCISVVSVLTAPLGAKLAHKLNVAQLKKTFGLVLFALAAYMLYKGIRLTL